MSYFLRVLSMKKVAIIVLIITLTFSLSGFYVKAADDGFAIIDGEAFSYEVITSDVYALIDDNEFTSSAFQLNGEQFNVSDALNVTVSGASISDINYTVACKNTEINHTVTNDNYHLYSIEFLISYYYLYVLQIATTIESGYSSADGNFSTMTLANGLLIDPLSFFVGDFANNWIYLEQLAIDMNSTTNVLYSNATFLPASTFYYESNNLVRFESFFYSRLKSSILDAEVSNSFSCVFNKSNGVLLGIKTKGSLNGLINEKSVYCLVDLQIVEESYDLPEYEYYYEIPKPLSLTNFALFTFGSFAIAVVFRKIRKRK